MNRSDAPHPRASQEAIDEAAADWFGRQDGGLQAREQAEFSAWLAADPRHAEAYARLERASAALDDLSAFRPLASRSADPDLPLRPRPAPQTRRAWLVPALAAAAAIAVAFVFLPPPETPDRMPNAGVATTEVGGLDRQVLADGSEIALNTDTVLEYVFSDSERRVTLVRGEAHFTVAKDPARPFVVSAGGVGVRAVGTAFNVRLHTDGIDVLVTEGRVRVDDDASGTPLLPAASTLLVPGQRTIVPTAFVADRSSRAPEIMTVPPTEISRLLAWREQQLAFDPMPLRNVVAEFNRYNRHQLRIADEETGELNVGGSFRSDDYETLVRLLESSFGIVAERRDGETILRQRR